MSEKDGLYSFQYSLYGSRGSVVGIAVRDIQTRRITYVGVGNTTYLVIPPN